MATKYARKGSAVYAALAATKLHPTAEQLYRSLAETYPNLSRTTVYANLSRLREDGSIVCIGVFDGSERFDAAIEPHAHFYCEHCGSVTDLPEFPDTAFLDRTAEQQSGGSVRRHELVFHGCCADCREETDGLVP